MVNALDYHSGDLGSRLHFVFFSSSTAFNLTSILKSAISYFIAHAFLFSSPVRKYRKGYCVGVGVVVGVAQLLKFLVKGFKCLYLLNTLMNQVDTLLVGRYWSEGLCCTIMINLSDLEVKVMD